MLLQLVCRCLWVPTRSHIGMCWLASICMPAGDTSAKSLHQWDTHLGGWGPEGGSGEGAECERLNGRGRERGGSGQAALTPRCLRPSHATDPVSNSPLLAPLMPATTSYHTICSGDCPALLNPTPTHTIIWPGLCIVISILLQTVYLLASRGTLWNMYRLHKAKDATLIPQVFISRLISLCSAVVVKMYLFIWLNNHTDAFSYFVFYLYCMDCSQKQCVIGAL